MNKKHSIPPLIVAGMHCSATSLVASLLAGLDVDFGTNMLAADFHNPEGYYEDVDFVEFQSRMMHSATLAEPGHPDWGWTESEVLDATEWEKHQHEAQQLLEKKATPGKRWGWKNPRTSVSLGFWQTLVPDATYLFVYRSPWAVADSMQRLGADVFLRHPDYAYRIWSFYNKRLLKFYQQHSERCLLVSANGLFADPESMDDLLRQRLGLDVPAGYVRSRLRPQIFTSDDNAGPLVSLLASVRPACLELLRELDAAAALASGTLWRPSTLVAASPPQEPRISVIIPCYNHGEFLLEAVASAERAARECSLEVVIVNDGSDQEWTIKILGCLRRLGYRVLDQPHSGLAAARNRGAAEARGAYLLPLDADDRLRPEFARKAADLLDSDPKAGVVYGDYWEFGLRRGRVAVPGFSLPELLRGNFIAACSLIRRSALKECRGWDESLAAWEDWDLWIGLAALGWGFRHTGSIAFDYRRRPDSMVAVSFGAGVGEQLQAYLVEKHRETYLRQLPEILIAVQERHREMDRLRVELIRAPEGLAAREWEFEERVSRLESAIREQATDLEEHRSARRRHSEELAQAGRERVLLDEERLRLYEELRAWRRRLAAVEDTTAWKVRSWLIRARRALSR